METNPKKYIFIVQVTRQLSIDIINYFSSQGAEITLFTGVVEPNYQNLEPKVDVRYSIKYNNSSGFQRLYTWSLFTVFSFFFILFKSRKKELILVTTPPFIVFIGLFLKKIRSQNYHLILWDLYPEVLVNFNVFKESSLVIRLWKRLNRSCFKHAKTVFTLGKHLADAIEKYKIKPIIIPNWVNSDFIKPVNRTENSFALKYNLVDKLVVMYSGNLGLTHDIESIINTAELLKKYDKIKFVIIGEGAKKGKIVKMAEEKSLSNILMLSYQDKEILPYSLTTADIGVVTLSQGAENISVPSKTYYMLAAGSAILALASHQSELGILIEKYKCGKVFDQSTPEEIAQYVLSLLEDKQQLSALKEKSRLASFNYTPENAKLYYQYICIQKY